MHHAQVPQMSNAYLARVLMWGQPNSASTVIRMVMSWLNVSELALYGYIYYMCGCTSVG